MRRKGEIKRATAKKSEKKIGLSSSVGVGDE